MSKESIDAKLNVLLKDLRKEIKEAIERTTRRDYFATELLNDASKDGNLEVVKYLLEKRQDYFNNEDIDIALYKAIYSDNVNVVKYLNEKGTKMKYFDDIYEVENKDIIKYLIETGAEMFATENCNFPEEFGKEVNDFARKLYLTKYAK